jgi:stringent starvation protein B
MTTSTKPYLVRALYEWMLDNNLTPFVALNTTIPGVKVPVQYIKDDQIVLNISPAATQDLNLTNQNLSFSASFSGLSHSIEAPMRALTMIYAKETGQGMAFDISVEEEEEGDNSGGAIGENRPGTPPKSPGPKGNTKKPILKVVK